MFEELLSFHRPGWVNGAEYYAHGILTLHQLGLLEGPRYPEGWFARVWEDRAIEIITVLDREYGEVSTTAFSEALEQAISEAEGSYSRWS